MITISKHMVIKFHGQVINIFFILLLFYAYLSLDDLGIRELEFP